VPILKKHEKKSRCLAGLHLNRLRERLKVFYSANSPRFFLGAGLFGGMEVSAVSFPNIQDHTSRADR
jgi:hypothetical protein